MNEKILPYDVKLKELMTAYTIDQDKDATPDKQSFGTKEAEEALKLIIETTAEIQESVQKKEGFFAFTKYFNNIKGFWSMINKSRELLLQELSDIDDSESEKLEHLIRAQMTKQYGDRGLVITKASIDLVRGFFLVSSAIARIATDDNE